MNLPHKKLIQLLTFSISIIYFWFGALKFFPNLSPAEEVAKSTIEILTFHLIPSKVGLSILAIWECTIAITLAINISKKVGVYLALIHMACTFLPFILLPIITYNNSFYSLTLVGQYIIKNIVIILSLLIIFPKHNNRYSIH